MRSWIAADAPASRAASTWLAVERGLGGEPRERLGDVELVADVAARARGSRGTRAAPPRRCRARGPARRCRSAARPGGGRRRAGGAARRPRRDAARTAPGARGPCRRSPARRARRRRRRGRRPRGRARAPRRRARRPAPSRAARSHAPASASSASASSPRRADAPGDRHRGLAQLGRGRVGGAARRGGRARSARRPRARRRRASAPPSSACSSGVLGVREARLRERELPVPVQRGGAHARSAPGGNSVERLLEPAAHLEVKAAATRRATDWKWLKKLAGNRDRPAAAAAGPTDELNAELHHVLGLDSWAEVVGSVAGASHARADRFVEMPGCPLSEPARRGHSVDGIDELLRRPCGPGKRLSA